MGCVSYSLRFFPDGKISKSAHEAGGARRAHRAAAHRRGLSRAATGSRRSARPAPCARIADVMQQNGFDDGGITPDGLDRLRSYLIKAGRHGQGRARGTAPRPRPGVPRRARDHERRAVRAEDRGHGGRGRRDARRACSTTCWDASTTRTCATSPSRSSCSATTSTRCRRAASRRSRFSLYRKLTDDSGEPDETAAQHIAWAARLHEIGISVAYSGYHKHSAYIINNADMPGFSQRRAARAVAARARPPPLAQQGRQAPGRARGGLEHGVRAAARGALLPQPGRRDAAQPAGQAARARSSGSAVDSGWLARNPLTATALHEEVREWDKIDFELKMPGLEEFETGTSSRSRADRSNSRLQLSGLAALTATPRTTAGPAPITART